MANIYVLLLYLDIMFIASILNCNNPIQASVPEETNATWFLADEGCGCNNCRHSKNVFLRNALWSSSLS